MSRISQKAAVAPLNPFANISTGVPSTAYSALPASGVQPSTGSGFFDPSLESCIGQKFETSDGRELVLVRNGAVALGAAKLVQGPDEQTTAFKGLAMTVPTTYPATAGLFQIYVTNGSTVINQNAFKGGFAIVASGTGIGQSFKISSHGPCAASGKVVINLEDPIQTTLDATSTITLIKNPYDGVLVQVANGSTQTSGPVGVSLYGIPASTAATFDGTSGALTANGVSQYGLLVCHGPVACTIKTTTTIGYPLGPSSVAGALSVATLTTSPQVGISMQTQVDSTVGLVYLML